MGRQGTSSTPESQHNVPPLIPKGQGAPASSSGIAAMVHDCMTPFSAGSETPPVDGICDFKGLRLPPVGSLCMGDFGCHPALASYILVEERGKPAPRLHIPANRRKCMTPRLRSGQAPEGRHRRRWLEMRTRRRWRGRQARPVMVRVECLWRDVAPDRWFMEAAALGGWYIFHSMEVNRLPCCLAMSKEHTWV